jgi:hypothetical protein
MKLYSNDVHGNYVNVFDGSICKVPELNSVFIIKNQFAYFIAEVNYIVDPAGLIEDYIIAYGIEGDICEAIAPEHLD